MNQRISASGKKVLRVGAGHESPSARGAGFETEA
jgi:hypothetical protein